MVKTLRDYIGPEKDPWKNRPKKPQPSWYSWEDTFDNDPREFCPKCNSSEIVQILESENPELNNNLDWGMALRNAITEGFEGPRYQCNECNFYYAFPPRKSSKWEF